MELDDDIGRLGESSCAPAVVVVPGRDSNLDEALGYDSHTRDAEGVKVDSTMKDRVLCVGKSPCLVLPSIY